MSFVRLLVLRAKRHKLLITNTVVNGVLFASGDFVVQQMERHQHYKQSDQIIPFADWKRTGHFFITGLCLGPVFHGWYTFLDRIFPKVNARNVFLKVLLDQSFACPVCITCFFVATGHLEGKSFMSIVDEIRRKFLAAYVVDWTIWPAAQTLNFFVVPPKFRVIFVSTITFFHSIFLSFIKNSEGKGREFIERVDKMFGL